MSILTHTQIGAQLATAVQGSRQPSDDQSDLEIFTNPTKNFFSNGYPRLLCFRAQVAVRMSCMFWTPWSGQKFFATVSGTVSRKCIMHHQCLLRKRLNTAHAAN